MNQLNKDNEKHGYWEHYYENGNLWAKGYYNNGERHGYWEEYYSNGNLMNKGYYINGLRHGIWGFYSEDGHLNERRSYKDNKYHGITETYGLYNSSKTILKQFHYNDFSRYYCEFVKDGKIIFKEFQI